MGDDTRARDLYVLHVQLQNGAGMQEARNVSLQATYMFFAGTGPLTSKVRLITPLVDSCTCEIHHRFEILPRNSDRF